jgi:polysaccharide biosynthesis protein PslH
MRILFVLPDLPHPPFTGAHTRPLMLLRAAARKHEVAVVGAAPPEADLTLLEELCVEVRMTPNGAARPVRRRGLAAGRRLVTPVPLVSAGRSRAVSDLVDEMVASWKPDALAVETLYAAHYRVPGVPLIVDLPDVPSGLCESAAAARPVRYLAANLQAATSRRYERRLLDDTIPIAINDGDRERLASLGVEAYTVPLTVELPPLDAVYERSSRARHDEAVRLLFIGSFVHPPNRDAARWLIRSLAPELRTERVPFALVIAGLQAPHWLSKAGGAGVTVISDAPDLDPLYRSADIVLAPLPHGGGTKNKTLEAMAWGLPVIGTPQAFTGLPQLDGEAFVVDPLDPLRVTRRIAVLRDDPGLRLHLGLVARRYVAAAHSPELSMDRAEALFEAVAGGGGVAEAEGLARERQEARDAAADVAMSDGEADVGAGDTSDAGSGEAAGDHPTS